MNQLPENPLRIYDVTLVTSYLIGLLINMSNCFNRLVEISSCPKLDFKFKF